MKSAQSHPLEKILEHRVAIIDGAMGTTIRTYGMKEGDILETNTFGATSIAQSEFFVDDPREHGGRKDPEFYQKIIDNESLNTLAWDINEQSARQCREWADR